MAKANPPAPAAPSSARAATPANPPAKSKQKIAVKPKSSAPGGKTVPAGKKAAVPAAHIAPPSAKVQAEAHETQEKIRELIKLAKEQGYLTWDDLNEALPDGVNDPDLIESIQTRLRSMEFDIIEASDVDRYKDLKKEQEADPRRKARRTRRRRRNPTRKRATPRAGWISSMIRCGCTSSRWGRCRC